MSHEQIFFKMFCAAMGILQLAAMFILNDIYKKLDSINEKVTDKIDKHLNDHAERKFCEPCLGMIEKMIPGK